MEKNLEKFKTSSIDLASFLMASGAEYVGVEKLGEGFFNFVFKDFFKCSDLKRTFASGGEAPALSLFEKRNFLISEVKGEQK